MGFARAGVTLPEIGHFDKYCELDRSAGRVSKGLWIGIDHRLSCTAGALGELPGEPLETEAIRKGAIRNGAVSIGRAGTDSLDLDWT